MPILPAVFERSLRSVPVTERDSKRRAFTLLEVLLVLAIMVVVASIALPNVLKTLQTQKLKRAADGVRNVWMKLNVRAMKTGRVQVFRYELGSGKYETKPWEADDSQVETSAKVNPAFAPTAVIEEKQMSLPDGIAFLSGDARFENRSASVEDQLSQSDGGGGWSRPLLFYPDGSTSTAHVVLGFEGKDNPDKDVGIRVKLRGLTGSVDVSDLMALSEVAQ